jgi:hypothetical protein
VITASADLVAVPEDLEAMPGRYNRLTQPVGILFGPATASSTRQRTARRWPQSSPAPTWN